MTLRAFILTFPLSNRDLRVSRKHNGDVKEERPLHAEFFKSRDGLAHMSLTHVCARAGYVFRPNHVILGLAPFAQQVLAKTSRLLRNADKIQLERDDLVLVTTRPPLDDHGAFEEDNPSNDETAVDELYHDKRWIARSGTAIEREVLTALRPLFGVCTRSNTAISSAFDLANTDAEIYRELVFFQKHSGRIQYARTTTAAGKPKAHRFHEPALTLGYVAAIPHVGAAGYRLLAAWGAGGAETLTLAQLLDGPFSDTFASALAADEPSLWLVPFRVPSRTPFPYLELDLPALQPNGSTSWRPLGPFRRRAAV